MSKTSDRSSTPSAASRRRKSYRRISVEEPPRGPQFLTVLLSLLGLAVSLWVILGRDAPPEEDLGPTPRTTRTQAEAGVGRVPSALYRPAIERLETALFAPRSGDPREASREISDAATDLQAALADRGDQRTEIDQVLDRIIAATDEQAIGYRRIRSLQNAWAEVRDLRFDRTDWMRSPSDDPDTDPTALAAYVGVSQRLVEALDEFTDDTAGVFSPEDTVVSDDDRSAWSAATSRLAQRTRSIERDLPDRPSARGAGEMLSAIQRFATVLRESQLLAASATPWTDDQVESLARRADSAAGDFGALAY